MTRDTFLKPACRWSTIDSFIARRRVLNALADRRGEFHGTLLDIGCGNMPYKSIVCAPPSRVDRYIGLDLAASGYGKPDIEWDGRSIPLARDSVDCAMATEVFEHCPEVEEVMREANRVLKPGGVLFFTVPFFWPLHDVPHDEYRYTPFSLRRHLEAAGFGQIQMRADGGWDASLAQMIGLWVRRSGLKRLGRLFATALALPVVSYLSSRDKPPKAFVDQTMATGISGTALKSGSPL